MAVRARTTMKRESPAIKQAAIAPAAVIVAERPPSKSNIKANSSNSSSR